MEEIRSNLNTKTFNRKYSNFNKNYNNSTNNSSGNMSLINQSGSGNQSGIMSKVDSINATKIK